MISNSRVKLPRDVAQSIEQLRKDGFDSRDIIEIAIQSKGTVLYDYANNISFDDLLDAITNGYDVKGTVHEEVRDYYREAQHVVWDYPDETEDPHYHRNAGIVDAVEFVLNELNVTIEGVNDK
jgi:hypothetical protein